MDTTEESILVEETSTTKASKDVSHKMETETSITKPDIPTEDQSPIEADNMAEDSSNNIQRTMEAANEGQEMALLVKEEPSLSAKETSTETSSISNVTIPLELRNFLAKMNLKKLNPNEEAKDIEIKLDKTSFSIEDLSGLLAKVSIIMNKLILQVNIYLG